MFVIFYKLAWELIAQKPPQFTPLEISAQYVTISAWPPRTTLQYSLSTLLSLPRHFLPTYSALFSTIHLLNTILSFCVLYFSSTLVWLDLIVKCFLFFPKKTQLEELRMREKKHYHFLTHGQHFCVIRIVSFSHYLYICLFTSILNNGFLLFSSHTV